MSSNKAKIEEFPQSSLFLCVMIWLMGEKGYEMYFYRNRYRFHDHQGGGLGWKSGMVYSDYVCHHQEVQKPSAIDPEHRFLSKCRGGGNIFCMNWRCWILILRHTAFQSYPICAWEPVKKQRGFLYFGCPCGWDPSAFLMGIWRLSCWDPFQMNAL